MVDVIDTFAIDEPDLPDDPKDRLFVCAHRYAWETGEQVTFRGDTNTAHLRVATIDALIAMKAHALRFGSRQRRQQKRSSDLHDLLLLAERAGTQILAGAPWQLAHQVRDALTEDLSDPATAAATLRAAGTPAADRFSADVVDAVTRRLLARLR